MQNMLFEYATTMQRAAGHATRSGSVYAAGRTRTCCSHSSSAREPLFANTHAWLSWDQFRLQELAICTHTRISTLHCLLAYPFHPFSTFGEWYSHVPQPPISSGNLIISVSTLDIASGVLDGFGWTPLMVTPGERRAARGMGWCWLYARQ